MNQVEQINARMLMMYPVESVKEYFGVKGYRLPIVTQVAFGKSEDEILDFAQKHFNLNKQHVYVFDMNPPFSPAKFNSKGNPFPHKIYKSWQDGDNYCFFIKPIVTYSGTVVDKETRAFTDIEMKFKQPIIITLSKTHLVIQAVILEKDIVSYLGKGKSVRAIEISKDVNDDFVESITSYFLTNGVALSKTDMNKGLKAMCDSDTLDLRIMKLNRHSSVDTIVMHDDKTFKQQYPEEYEKAMLYPLFKSAFKYLGIDNLLCKQFVADPAIGQITISLYPTGSEQIKNVIYHIISNN